MYGLMKAYGIDHKDVMEVGHVQFATTHRVGIHYGRRPKKLHNKATLLVKSKNLNPRSLQ